MNKRDFVTFLVAHVKHSVTRRPRIRESVKPNKERKERRIALRSNDTAVQLCGDSNLAEKWINSHHATGQKYKE